MAFTLQTWGRWNVTMNEPLQTLTGGALVGCNRGFTYSTSDSQASVTPSGYFNTQAYEITSGDILYVWSTTDSTGILYTLSNDNGVIQASSLASSPNIVSSGALSSAQILAMYATPAQIIPAQGANRLIFVNSFQYELVYAGTAYAAGGNTGLQYGNTAHLAGTAASGTFANTVLQNTANFVGSVAGALAPVASATVTNQGIFISNASAAYTTGTGALSYEINYSVYATV